jgi:hypothetical protein
MKTERKQLIQENLPFSRMAIAHTLKKVFETFLKDC